MSDVAGGNFESTLGTIVGSVWDLVYQAPVMLAAGEWWALTPDERADLVEASLNYLNSFEKGDRKAAMEWLKRYMPAAALVGTVLMISYPKYKQTVARRGANLAKPVTRPVAVKPDAPRAGRGPTAAPEGDHERESPDSFLTP